MADLIEKPDSANVLVPADELAEGFGLVTYYASSYENSVAKSYQTGKSLTYSDDITIAFTGEVVNDTKTFFSGTFQRPRTVKGAVLLNWCVGAIQGAGGQTMTFEVKLYHFDGTTSTQIGATWTSATLALTAGVKIDAFNAIIPITTAKKFKAGDSIKMEFKSTGTTIAGGFLEYGIDPQNRDSNAASQLLTPSSNFSSFTQMLLQIPFKNVRR